MRVVSNIWSHIYHVSCVMHHVGGTALLQAWALEQEEGSRRRFHEQNVLVPWKLQTKFSLREEEPVAGEEGVPICLYIRSVQIIISLTE
jgi:hypothetical protein